MWCWVVWTLMPGQKMGYIARLNRVIGRISLFMSRYQNITLAGRKLTPEKELCE